MINETTRDFTKIESYGIRGDQVRLTPDTIGFSGKTSPASREHFNQPHGVALTSLETIHGRAVLAYRPAVETYHKRHDAVGIVQSVDGKLVMSICDGVSTLNLMGTHVSDPPSQLYSHHLVTHLKPFSNEDQARSWLADLPKVDNPGVLGASTLKAMTVELIGSEYQISLAQLGNIKEGAQVGSTIAIHPDGTIQKITIGSDTLPYLGNGHASLDFQQFTLPRGTIIAMASDGLSSEGFMSLIRGEHYQFEQYCKDRLRDPMVKLQPYGILSTLKDLVPNNRDDGTIAFLWLK